MRCCLLLLGITAAVSSPSYGAGRYVLAYMREIGYYENHDPPGNHSAYVHVWDENGNAKSGVSICLPDGSELGTTDSYGFVEVALWTGGDYYFKCQDGQGSASDTSYVMSTRRYPSWGHYSYELGFMFKASASSPGTFDITVLCPPFKAYNENADTVPYTASLCYYSTSCSDWQTDPYDLTPSCSVYYQTFTACMNRIVAAKIQATAGGGTQIYWSAQILQGGPGGAPVGPVRTTRLMWSDEYEPILLKWPVNGANAVQVTPGQTYCLKVFRSDANGNPSGGMVTYWTNNNYSSGTFYCGTTSYPSHDLVGLVVGLQYADGAIAGSVKTAGGAAISGATVTAVPGNYTATSQSDGTYTIQAVPAGTYSVKASKSGYATHVEQNVQVNISQTTTVSFTLSTSFGTLSGEVRNAATQAGLPDAAVSTSPGGYTATSDASGNYTISNMEIGTYDVTGSKDGYGPQTQSNVAIINGQTTTCNLDLPANTITGYVKDSSNRALSQATVTANPGNLTRQTAADGSYTFSAIPAGTYSLTASKEGYASMTNAGVVLNPGQTVISSFSLPLVGTNVALSAVTYLECGHSNAAEIGLSGHDGNATSTKWCCKHNGSQVPGDHWLAYDLGSNVNVSQYVVKNASWLGEPADNVGSWDTRGLVIESGGSLRGPWTAEFSTANNAQATCTFTYGTPKALRYVRLRVTQPTQDDSNWAARIPEFEVWGFAGTPGAIRFEAEDYDSGANAVEGTDYHDTTTGNSGSEYRGQDVDIEACSEGGYDVFNTAAGEWLRYRLKGGGTFRFQIRHAGASGGTCHLEIDGANLSGSVSLPATGGAQTWQTYNGPVLAIGGGDHIVKFVEDSGGCSLNYFVLTPQISGPGDFDGDGDVDQADFGRFQQCLTGAGANQDDSTCAGAKLDADTDVDQDDFTIFLGCLSGPGVPSDPNCAH